MPKYSMHKAILRLLARTECVSQKKKQQQKSQTIAIEKSTITCR